MRIPGLSFVIRILPSVLVILIISLVLYVIWRFLVRKLAISAISKYKTWRQDRELQRNIKEVLRNRR